MNVFRERFRHCISGGIFRFMIGLLICTFFFSASLMVNVSPVPTYAADLSKTYTTDVPGRFWGQLDVPALNPTLVAVQARNNSQTFNLAGRGGSSFNFVQDVPQDFPVGTAVNSAAFTLSDSADPTSVQDKAITLAWSGTGTFDAPSASAVTNGSGKFILTSLTGLTGGAATLTVTLPDGRTASCNLTVGTGVYTISLTATNGGAFSGGISTGSVSGTVLLDGHPVPDGSTVTWSLTNSTKDASAVSNLRADNTYYGLAWGTSATTAPDTEITLTTTSSISGGTGAAVISLTDIVGERTITVQAAIGSVTQAGQVTFGPGPLSVFTTPLSRTYRWADNMPLSNPGNTLGSNFPAANACGTTLSVTELRALSGGYDSRTKLPSVAQLQAVSEPGSGAWSAAGWPVGTYWSGGVSGDANNALLVYRGGPIGASPVSIDNPVVCLR